MRTARGNGAPPGAALEGFPTLYDDGPWTDGGHEPPGAKPGDHLWGTTAFVVPPPEGEVEFQYGVTARTRCKNAAAWVPQPVTFGWSGNPTVIAPSACAE